MEASSMTGGSYSWLKRLKTLPADIRVVMAGAGAMGRGLLYQCEVTPGFRCAALADTNVQRAVDCAKAMDIAYRVVESRGELNDAVEDGLLAITDDADLVARTESADVFMDATNAIAAAGEFCCTAIEHGMHLIMMNAEADLAFGPWFLHLARKNGVVYTSCDGDQHGVIKRLVDDLELWGFELVLAGNIKGYLDRYANPTSIIPEADKRNLDYEMCTAYTDGTKLCIEMALLANALGLRTDITGMHGPRAAHARDALHLFDLDAMRNGPAPVVDYVLGAQPNGGVFAVGYCDDTYQKDMMAYYKMGSGPYYVFFRPYHLCHVESMEAVAAAHLDGQSLLQPDSGFRTDVFAYAKKDLQAGDRLDGIGGYACYGQIENLDEEGVAPGIPMCLADDLTLKRDISRDARISLDDVEVKWDRIDFRLYRKAMGV
jgi:predicted homoserine dehydrogenase-like protein